ncbi:GDSL esterase/lipase At2g27360-like [Andrographis paniculata]|uniref:GDSL esterase/lipase At2g27360-like n=1 Tax=Andrographis paniculata TaxID=175694 RepID=UPI0021E8E0C6|nr:GDSL esterase/lipase At2g27360-like [Andrographis paniculata]
MEWFRTFLAGFPDGRKYLERSLIILGPQGGNDYSLLFIGGWTLDKVQPLAPLVVSGLGSTIQELIELGVVTILVPENFPFGCLPEYPTLYDESSSENYYDTQSGCLSWLNEFSRYHNDLLQKEVQRIRELYPHVDIMYGDYYNVVM